VHKNNPHTGRYDLQSLIKSNPVLADFVHVNPYDKETIDFHNADAVKCLNQSLLKKYYKIDHWDIPEGYLCPPIPGRADYIHHISDLLTYGKVIARGSQIRLLDIGVGSNCIYPLIAHSLFGWSSVGSDIDKVALANAQSIIDKNQLKDSIKLKYQKDKEQLLDGVIAKEDVFDVVICNPPFHESAFDAQQANRRKNKNLNKGKKAALLRQTSSQEENKSAQRLRRVKNFGGQSNELWYEGGEVAFIAKLIRESRDYSRSVYWYTTLVSKESNLPKIISYLNNEKPADYKIVEMTQGQKKSRFLAWTYLPTKTRRIWDDTRWRG